MPHIRKLFVEDPPLYECVFSDHSVSYLVVVYLQQVYCVLFYYLDAIFELQKCLPMFHVFFMSSLVFSAGIEDSIEPTEGQYNCFTDASRVIAFCVSHNFFEPRYPFKARPIGGI